MVRALIFAATAATLLATRAAGAELPAHDAVRGDAIEDAEIRGGSLGPAWRAAPWDDLEAMQLRPGHYEVRVRATAGPGLRAVELPVCQVRGAVSVDGAKVNAPERAPALVDLGADGPHDVVMALEVSSYEHRVTCGSAPRAGVVGRSAEGLALLTFDSPHAKKGGGEAVVFVPPGHVPGAPAKLLVGTHPWNCDIWTYASYAEHLRVAAERDVVLLMPSGLGNSLYIAPAEDEVMRAIAALSAAITVDARAVSIFGASMGGAGATTIGFHHPDHFASITSFFGDSKYDVTTYVRSILPDDPTAHQVNALDIVENARNVPVWLIHGEQDHTSPIVQSELLYRAMKSRGYDVRFDPIPGRGHEGELVARFLPDIVERASRLRVPDPPARVTYWSVRPTDTGAYGITVERKHHRGDAYVDVEREGTHVRVHVARGVRSIELARGAFGFPSDATPTIDLDDDALPVSASWAAQ